MQAWILALGPRFEQLIVAHGRLLWLPRVDLARSDSSLAITELHVGVLRCSLRSVCAVASRLCRSCGLCQTARPEDTRYCTTPFAEAEQSNHEEKAKVDENRSHLPPAQGSESISWCYPRLLGGSLTFRRILCSIFVDRHKCSPR